MNQVGEQFASLRYSCFLFDGYFVAMLGRLERKVWSDIAMENLNLLRHFHLTHQGACFSRKFPADQTQSEQQKGFLMIDTVGMIGFL